MYRPKKDKPNIAVLTVAMFGLFIISALLFQREVVSGNVWAMGVSLGGMPKEAAHDLMREKILELQQGPLVFTAGSKSVEVNPRDIGLLLDESAFLESLDGYVSSRPRMWPSFLSRLGSKKVMAAPVTISATGSHDIMAKIAADLSFPPQPARYGFSGKDLQLLRPCEGQVVTKEEVSTALNGISGTRVEVTFTSTAPPESEELHELQLLGEYSTKYDVEYTDRNVNLSLAAEAIHGKVLKPGDVFSFNKEAGERTEEKGYRYANVVVGDHLEPGLAGGICQVTTTLFDAAAFAGLDFPFISAHGIPVDYVPPGMDAAVAWNYLDLKIKNTTSGPVVFGAWVQDGQVTVRVFGKSNGHTYEIDPVTITEYPAEGKRPGLLVETYRIEKAGGKEISRTLLVRSLYQPSYPPPNK